MANIRELLDEYDRASAEERRAARAYQDAAARRKAAREAIVKAVGSQWQVSVELNDTVARGDGPTV